ncbi:unnamed protein product [Acanthosepion pharaonis]|uniref:SWIM-type domain-containing protein n=1 Tax=Acanthosepion pharaonis TaxID=158019 RepID=A0A812DX28_ACAPH|nr:unnamed protein product [Sepia pharaonis]
MENQQQDKQLTTISMQEEEEEQQRKLGVLVSSVETQLMSKVSLAYKETSTLSDELLSALQLVYEIQLHPALELVDNQAVIRMECPSKRQIYQVIDSSGVIYTCFQNNNYCSCSTYTYSVLVNDEHILCQHVLALRLSEAMEVTKTSLVSDKEMSCPHSVHSHLLGILFLWTTAQGLGLSMMYFENGSILQTTNQGSLYKCSNMGSPSSLLGILPEPSPSFSHLIKPVFFLFCVKCLSPSLPEGHGRSCTFPEIPPEPFPLCSLDQTRPPRARDGLAQMAKF